MVHGTPANDGRSPSDDMVCFHYNEIEFAIANLTKGIACADLCVVSNHSH